MRFNLAFFIAFIGTLILVLGIQLVLRSTSAPVWLNPLIYYGPSLFGTLSAGFLILSLAKQKKNCFFGIIGLCSGALWYEFYQIRQTNRTFDVGDVIAVFISGAILMSIYKFAYRSKHVDTH